MTRGPHLFGPSPTGGVLVVSVVCGGPAVSDARAQPGQTDHSRRHGHLDVKSETFVQEARNHCWGRSATIPGIVVPCLLAAFLKGKAFVGDFS
jgi:hypothetical protein